MTLPAAAARASADMDRYMGYAAPEADDRYLLPAPRLLQLADVVRRDGRTDGRTDELAPDRYTAMRRHAVKLASMRRLAVAETVRRLVTDGQTDGWIQDDRIYRASIASLGIK